MYQHSNELEEVGIISLTGVKVEHSTHMEILLGVCDGDVIERCL